MTDLQTTLPAKISKLAIIGVGLIGGSFALKLKQLGLVDKVCGCGRNQENLELAVKMGVIDEFALQPDLVVADADLVIISVPIASIAPIYQQILPALKPTAVVSDVGSVKQSVLDDIAKLLGEVPNRFVAAHPIAGREQSGVAAVEADLYLDHKVILTPTETTDQDALNLVENLWQAVGAEVSSMDAKAHDEIFAATSHLPHILAFALVDMLNNSKDLGNVFQYTAGGFRDFTRIASSDATMWRDIALNNKAALLAWIRNYQQELDKMSKLIAEDKSDEIKDIFAEAKQARDTHVLHKTSC